ncbi:MAG: undecaprenyl/decaprenyl-phosphate alpha-N-acetylglucosaminyl 1-phosphate transferase [Armatimonadetes bacterium]|nr:undecaprenyl/decaprenyl-phosphate alpha-N-acetylglucosaminyl 1-phosphate transferase [Armatimonadota bacterium]
MTFATSFIIAVFIALFGTPLVRRLAIRMGAIDRPEEGRRVHKKPTPRWGGIAVFLAVAAAWLAVYPISHIAQGEPTVGPYTVNSIWIFGIGLAVVLFGLLDDRLPIPPAGQALFLLTCGVVLAHPSLGDIRIEGITRPFTAPGAEGGYIGFSQLNSVIFTAVFVFVIAKTMDTIDGIDGLAAGIAAIGAATMFILALNEQPLIGVLSAAVMGACLGFLRHNYHPAKIFLGTGGAQFLGYFLAAVSIQGVMKTAATVALILPLLMFGVQVFDALFVVARRIFSGQPITKPDMRHIHHTLLGRGLSQRQTVWILYVFAILLCATAVLVVKLAA